MELNEIEKAAFQVEGDYQSKVLNELYMTVRYSNDSEQREADLFAYLQFHEPGVLKRDGPNCRHKEHDSSMRKSPA